MISVFRGYITVFVMLFILVSGCGRKTDLVPPQRLVPAMITDLRYVLDEKGVTLEWSFPTAMENGEQLEIIEIFEVLRAAVKEADYCEGCPVFYDEPVVLEGGSLPAAGETRIAEYKEAYLQI